MNKEIKLFIVLINLFMYSKNVNDTCEKTKNDTCEITSLTDMTIEYN